MLPYDSSHFQTPGDRGPPADIPSSLFLTPGDIGPPAQLGLKHRNMDTTDTLPRKLKHRARTAKEKGTPLPINDLPLLRKIEHSPIASPTNVTPSNLTLSNFESNEQDYHATSKAKRKYFEYIALKAASASSSSHV